MTEELEEIKATSKKEGDGLALRVVQRKLRKICDLDLSLYKPKQVKRLLESALRRYGLSSYGELLEKLRKDPVMLQNFKGRMSINVSEFFRDPVRFEYLEENVLEELVHKSRGLNVWSAGCSIGCEPYSVAMLLWKKNALRGCRILGTDIDDDSLHRAQEALYWEDEIRYVPRSLRNRFFASAMDVEEQRLPSPQRRKPDGSLEDIYQLEDKIQRVVTCRQENVFTSRYKQDFDLIVCRNMAIYFTEEAKSQLYNILYQALRPGGYIFVGGTEIIFQAEEIGLKNPAPFFYRKMS